MADASCSEGFSVQVSKRTLSDKKGNVCKCCEKIKVELNEVKLELDSCREIIRVLQEKLRDISPPIQPAVNKTNEDCKDKESYNSLTSEEWTSFSLNRRRNQQYTRRNLRQLPLQTFNQVDPISNLNDSAFQKYVPSVKRSQPLKKHQPRIQSAKETKNVKQKVVIIGESHARNSLTELQHSLDSTFSVSSFVKPGAGMKVLVDTVKEDIEKFASEDVIVVWGGSNDSGKINSKEALRHV